MKLTEIKNTKHNIISESARVGREYNHLEDLVFIEGSRGVTRALKILENLQAQTETVAVKWDGNPTIYWGRDQQGTFVLTGKNGWGRDKTCSPASLREFVMSTGKGEEWRVDFADTLAEAFEILEQNTPKDFRGYVYGDILWHSRNSQTVTESHAEFTPNKVTYIVEDETVRNRIEKSKIGIAVHKVFENFGDKQGATLTEAESLNTDNVVVFAQTTVSESIDLNQDLLERINTWNANYGKAVDEFLEKRKGLSDLKNIIYTYVNQTVKENRLDILTTGFYKWLSNSKVSQPKQKRIQELDDLYGDLIETVLEGVELVMTAKNSVIEQFDNKSNNIKCLTEGEAGGEGYVAVDSFVKLVPRHRWKPN